MYGSYNYMNPMMGGIGYDNGWNMSPSFGNYFTPNPYAPMSGPKLNLNPQQQEGATPPTKQTQLPNIPLQTILTDNSKAATLGSSEIALGLVEGATVLFLLKKGSSATFKKLASKFTRATGKAASDVPQQTTLSLPKPTTKTTTTAAGDSFTLNAGTTSASANTAASATGTVTADSAKHLWSRLSSTEKREFINTYGKTIQSATIEHFTAQGITLSGEDKHRIFRLVTQYLNQANSKGISLLDPEIKKKVAQIAIKAVNV